MLQILAPGDPPEEHRLGDPPLFRTQREVDVRDHEANQANAGQAVEMTWDLLVTDLDPAGQVVFEIDRGHLGATTLIVSNYEGTQPVEVKSIQWGGINEGSNENTFRDQLPAEVLMGAP